MKPRRIALAAGLIMLIAGTQFLSAQRMHSGPMHRRNRALVTNSFGQFLDEYEGANLGDLTVGEVVAIASRMSIARQKLAYVQRARFASFHVPGMGHFLTGDTGLGALFLLAGLSSSIGTLVGSYYVLPDDLQLDSLNYLTEPFADIENAWKAHSLNDYLPSIGVMAGGMLVHGVIRALSAGSAARAARENIRNETVQFEAEPFMMLAGPQGMGMWMGMRMRFK